MSGSIRLVSNNSKRRGNEDHYVRFDFRENEIMIEAHYGDTTIMIPVSWADMVRLGNKLRATPQFDREIHD